MTGKTAPVAAAEPLLERSGQLESLRRLWEEVAAGDGGRLAFVRGHAGAGKSALLRSFCEGHPRVLCGSCDPLFAPRALGPFADIARASAGELAQRIVTEVRPWEVLDALLHDLGRGPPALLVLEDVHWADEATLDVLRLLGRRVETVPALVVASYRDDELGVDHPLHILVGELASATGIARIDVPALSPQAVAVLAAPFGVDVEALYGRTGGNAFFVVETLRGGTDEIPATIREAVLARMARLTTGARTVLEAVAILGTHARLDVLSAVAAHSVWDLDEALASGLLVAADRAVAYRHELARQAVVESLPPHHRVRLHALGLAALEEAGETDAALLAHHAGAAGDADAVLRHAPRAAAAASARGAHRESVALYGLALEAGRPLPARERAELLERRAADCRAIDETGTAVTALTEAIAIRRELDDPRAEGRGLLLLSEVLWCPGRVSASGEAADDALSVLEPVGPSRELAMAHVRLSELCAYRGDLDDALAWGERALAQADELGSDDLALDARTNIALARALAGQPGGCEDMDHCHREARVAGLDEIAGRAIVDLVWVETMHHDRGGARRHIEMGLEHARERGLERWRCYLLGYRARLDLAAGRWDDAVEAAEAVLREGRASSIPRVASSVVIGLVRARRGEPGAWDALDDALALSEHSEGLAIELVAAARAETAWLEGDRDGVARATATDFAGLPWTAAEMALWRRRAGIADPPPVVEFAGPHALELAGDPAGASAAWRELECPHEAALALLDSDDVDAQRAAHEELLSLGARPAASNLARRLRARGQHVPSGPRLRTRENPAGLTARELEVLALVAEGLRNAQIADRLVVSTKTVDHHVSSILHKLDVSTRGQAGAEAVRRGLIARASP